MTQPHVLSSFQFYKNALEDNAKYEKQRAQAWKEVRKISYLVLCHSALSIHEW